MAKVLVVMENVQDRTAFSGGRYHAWLVVNAMADLGHKVSVMTGRVPFFVQDLPGDFSKVKILERKPMLKSDNCRLMPGDGDFDLVCVFPLKATPWGVNLAVSHSLPVFTWVFDPFMMVNQYAPGVGGRMPFGNSYLDALQKSTVIVASTYVSSQHILAYVGTEARVQVLYPCANSVIAEKVAMALEPSPIVRIMTITRGTSHKRPAHVFQAFRELLRNGVDAKLHVLSGFGDGRLQQLSRRYHVDQRCVFEARCDEARKWGLLKSMDLMLGASVYEGFGLWLMEAIYSCVPFVVYDFPVFKEMSRGGGGWFADYDRPDMLSKALLEAATNDRLVQTQHLTSIASTFTFESFKRRVARLLANYEK